ncbi:magnesium transporter MRS2-3-like isoform X2 [Zingiber officinale]|uniref:magnesium transporter MRS2-3-like isoform X2 n=1 Tax=Zingiber officinale TaxID=94328 RepID=UPI001C4A9CE6|nr:magnesium transporter MRS2-3-like isoform X2 [Zingiber officinale]
MRKAPRSSPAAGEPDPATIGGARVLSTSARKKGVGPRTWLVVDAAGEARVVEAGKHAIMRRTGLPGRDLRILDPQLAYPSTLLGRESAVVVNLEHIKAIVTATEVLLLSYSDPDVAPFVHELQRRLAGRHHGRDQSSKLEKEAHPALDKLTSKISSLNLEHVRQIKSRLVAISGRVQKVRDELEHLLDDDEDMAEMYLTEKMMRQDASDGSSHSSLYGHGNGIDDDRACAEILSEDNDIETSRQGYSKNISRHYRVPEAIAINRDNQATRTYSTRSSSKHLDVQELEMLLEAYFIQIDSTLNNLSTLREYVDDTEDYINIMLDDKQNQLLQIGVVLTTATLIVSVFVAIVGVFGMNIQVSLFDEKKSGTTEFLWTIGGGTIGSVLLYVISIAWCKRRRLLE